MTLLLFDIDGTLLLSGGAGIRAMNRAGKEIFNNEFTFDGIEVSGGLDPLLFNEAARRFGIPDPETYHDAFRTLYIRLLHEELTAGSARAHALPGVLALLDELQSCDDLVLGLLTGNYRQAAPYKLASVGIANAVFKVAVYGDDAPNRAALVALAIEEYQRGGAILTNPREVVVIGDTPKDIDCAHANGGRCVAVATGRYSLQELISAGADLALSDLTKTDLLFSFLYQI
jgi:phosphoglycolate phosphatase